MKVICVKCGDRLTKIKLGVLVITENGSAFRGDLYGCETCEFHVITSLGSELSEESKNRTLEHYPEDRVFRVS